MYCNGAASNNSEEATRQLGKSTGREMVLTLVSKATDICTKWFQSQHQRSLDSTLV